MSKRHAWSDRKNERWTNPDEQPWQACGHCSPLFLFFWVEGPAASPSTSIPSAQPRRAGQRCNVEQGNTAPEQRCGSRALYNTPCGICGSSALAAPAPLRTHPRRPPGPPCHQRQPLPRHQSAPAEPPARVKQEGRVSTARACACLVEAALACCKSWQVTIWMRPPACSPHRLAAEIDQASGHPPEGATNQQ